HPKRYLETVNWVADSGATERIELEAYGKVTSVRAAYRNGLEVEYAIAAADWASEPFDAGTGEVARDGIVVLLDRDGHATRLAEALGPPNPRLQRTALRAASEPPGRSAVSKRIQGATAWG